MHADQPTLDADQVIAEDATAFEEALTAGVANEVKSPSPEAEEEAPKKEDSPKDVKKEAEPEKKDEKPEEKKPEKKEEPKPEEKPKEEEPTKNIKLPKPASKFPDLKPGDYEISTEGTYVVKDDILAQDLNTVLTEKMGMYLNIFKAKPAKGEAMAQILGFKGDDTRTPGRQLADVVRALDKSSDKDTSARLVKQHFPYLVDRSVPMPFTFGQGVNLTGEQPTMEREEIAKETADTGAFTDDDALNALYRVVAESEGLLKMDDVKMEDLTGDIEKYKFDMETGKILPIYERMRLAIDTVYADKLSKEKEETDDDDRQVPTGGARRAGTKGKSKTDSQETAFENALKINL